MRLTVVVSDFPPVGEGEVRAPDAAALSTILSRAHRSPLTAGWQRDLASRLLALIGASPGAISAAAIPRARGLDAWCATPVHLQAGLDHLRLPADGLVVLPDDECAALAADFERVFAGSGMQLHPARGRFVLTGLAPGDGGGDPADHLGTRLAAHPGGNAAWRRLSSEIELWLHARGASQTTPRRHAVNALWLWGGGGAVDVASAARTPADLRIHGDDPFIAGVAVLAGVPHASPPPGIDGLLDGGEAGEVLLQVSLAQPPDGARSALAEIDDRWLAPALQLLRERRLTALDVRVGPVRAVLTRAGLARFWRRRRAWWEHLRR